LLIVGVMGLSPFQSTGAPSEAHGPVPQHPGLLLSALDHLGPILYHLSKMTKILLFDF